MRISDEEVIKYFEKEVVEPLKLKNEKIRVCAIGNFGFEILSPEEILEHMKAKDEIGLRHLEVHRHYLEHIRKKR